MDASSFSPHGSLEMDTGQPGLVTADIEQAAHGGQLRLRSYQDEMLEESLRHNTIVVLDTGAGKTQIAMARIRAELESCDNDKLAWFMAPTGTSSILIHIAMSAN
ncbi:hypothetical protein AAFC00_006179 [Neodothiora populina]|uniref:Helicase/UvrB N-terminal domain-containing protein n=1 Tax=Neodothiora populina TaxID=2781224 RepID=A0ABR3P4K5_9PEZI